MSNEYSSGSGHGFEWSDNQSGFAVFDLNTMRFKKTFHAVNGYNARLMVMQSNESLLMFGYGNGPFIDLFDINLQTLLGRDSWTCFTMSHNDDIRCAGSDSECSMLVYGSNDDEENALMRWSMQSKRFETLGTWDEDILFQNSITCIDGSTLLFF